jgi:hypothetical protein
VYILENTLPLHPWAEVSTMSFGYEKEEEKIRKYERKRRKENIEVKKVK